jgi:hypothetical protein
LDNLAYIPSVASVERLDKLDEQYPQAGTPSSAFGTGVGMKFAFPSSGLSSLDLAGMVTAMDAEAASSAAAIATIAANPVIPSAAATVSSVVVAAKQPFSTLPHSSSVENFLMLVRMGVLPDPDTDTLRETLATSRTAKAAEQGGIDAAGLNSGATTTTSSPATAPALMPPRPPSHRLVAAVAPVLVTAETLLNSAPRLCDGRPGPSLLKLLAVPVTSTTTSESNGDDDEDDDDVDYDEPTQSHKPFSCVGPVEIALLGGKRKAEEQLEKGGREQE